MSSRASARIDLRLILIASVVPLVPAWRVDRVFDYVIPDDLAERVAIGSLVRARFGGRNVRGVVTELRRATPERELEQVTGLVVEPPVAPAPLQELFEWMAQRYVVPRGKAFARCVPPRVRVVPAAPVDLRSQAAPRLIPAYEGGEELLGAIGATGSGVWCIECLPGEDRARLIAELAGAALAARKGATLVAVPEVRYGSRVLEGLEQAFGELARVDSAISEGQRSRAWLELAGGHRLGAGGRAAVLAPAPSLRLIVLDEEHHPTYKEDRAPRYDARRVAVERARRQSAVCVFVSATPSVETGAALLDGEYGSVVPGRAARRAARPLVEIIEADESRPVSHALHMRIRDVIRDEGRVALLAPARGYARALWCSECRHSLRCRACEAGLAVDRQTEGRGRSARLRCPRCGRITDLPDTCPRCGSVEFRSMGAGSQRLADQLTRAFPRATVVHMDPESVEDSATAARAADIYVTTWIGTKAALRPEVSFVGVIDADALIRKPNFRAAEHAFHALSEMAEWAGPAAEGGRLVIQSRESNHYVLQAIVRADYRFFLRHEMEQRKDLRYPPFSELVKVTASGGDAEGVLQQIEADARALSASVLGPITMRSAGRTAQQLLVKSRNAQELAEAMRPLASNAPRDLRLSFDIDPR